MSLETTIKELKTLKPFAEENVEEGPYETLNGRRGRKNNAIEQISNLKRQYLSELLASAIFIVTVGSKRDEFEKIATGKGFNLFSTDPETFYKDLASRVDKRVYGFAGQTDIFDILGRHLEDKMIELGLTQYNQLIFKESYIQPINNLEQLTGVIKTAINDQIGAEIVAVQAVNSIVDKAVEVEHKTPTTPIVLNTKDEKLALDLIRDLQLKRPAYLVVVGDASEKLKNVDGAVVLEEATKLTVKSVLDQIKRGKQ
jgi:hypothetical protein